MKHLISNEESDFVKVECSGALENSMDLNFIEVYLSENKSVNLIMTEITYINSCGFGALVEETMNFSDANLKVMVSGMNSQVRKTMEILGGEVLLNFLD
jgi:anti-anti-sigma factor